MMKQGNPGNVGSCQNWLDTTTGQRGIKAVMPNFHQEEPEEGVVFDGGDSAELGVHLRTWTVTDVRVLFTGIGSGIPTSGAACPRSSRFRNLICKGQWNLIRGADDFDTIVSALTNLQEWHGSYSKQNSKSYLTMAVYL
ncbi:hypothetical protein QBC37DRAFT_67304 [Rhypophila decipiens]|uniref:Uncharacterized protein n=1 Tax=Rhypophila decipiens TaxID=261697 RepID=A0AAN6YHV1_9PEZI|nr:hypothetical protein QBC37DRAFT_67304 [Rhypophila decipiens]